MCKRKDLTSSWPMYVLMLGLMSEFVLGTYPFVILKLCPNMQSSVAVTSCKIHLSTISIGGPCIL